MPTRESVDIPGLGTRIQMKIDGTFADIPGATNIEYGDFSLGVRNPNVLTDRRVRKRPTMTNLGKVSFSVWHDPLDATHQALQGRILTPPAAADEFKILFKDGSATTPSNIDFKGYVVAYPISGIETEGTVESKVEVEVTDFFAATPGV